MQKYQRLKLDNLFTDTIVALASQRTSLDFIVLYWTFDWLDLKMLESIVSVLPSDWCSLCGWPWFQ